MADDVRSKILIHPSILAFIIRQLPIQTVNVQPSGALESDGSCCRTNSQRPIIKATKSKGKEVQMSYVS